MEAYSWIVFVGCCSCVPDNYVVACCDANDGLYSLLLYSVSNSMQIECCVAYIGYYSIFTDYRTDSNIIVIL